MSYKVHTNDHDFFAGDHAREFLRNHKTGIDNYGRQYLGGIVYPYQNPTVLDVACGTAVNWECWKSMGIDCQYTGFDLTQQFLDIAKEKYGDEISLVRGYAQELSQKFEPDSFDIVVVRHLLEHIYEGQYEEIVRSALDIALKELVLVFFLHPHNGNEDTIEKRSSNIPEHPEVSHYWNVYSWPKMQQFFASLGVRVVTEVIATPGAAHADFIVRLVK